MSQWVRLCGVGEAPTIGGVMEAEAGDVAICLANLDGNLCALENLCPHREGPLGQGWIEGGAVVCPWHSWAFDLKTGEADYPEGERVAVFPLRIEGDAVMIEVT